MNSTTQTSRSELQKLLTGVQAFAALFFCWFDQEAALIGSPEWIPIRILTGTSGMWRMWKVPTELRMFRDMLAISAACLLPFLLGRPEATM